MPDINLTFLKDDDALTAAALEARSTSVEAGVNGVMSYGPRAGALNSSHVDTLVIETGVTDNTSPTAVDTLYITGSGVHHYTILYSAFDTNGTTDRHVIGTGGIPGPTGYDSDNQLLFNISPGILLGMTYSSRIMGILVLMNVEFETYNPLGTAADIWVMTCIQFLASGVWRTLGRSERFTERRISSDTTWAPLRDFEVNQDIPHRHLIGPADILAESLDPATVTVEGVRGMVAVFEPAAPPSAVTVDYIVLGSCQMTIIPLHAEAV